MSNAQPSVNPSSARRGSRIGSGTIWCGTFLGALALYVATAHRGVQWQDSGWQQLRIVTGQIDHPSGLVLTHPLQYYVGRAAIRLPIAEPAFAITLVSSLAGAIAIANLAATIHLLTRQTPAALIAATGFMLSHTFWQHATHTETYALVAALLTTEWLCLAAFIRSGRGLFIVLLAGANGLGLANHLLAALATPIDAILVVWAVRNSRVGIRIAAVSAFVWLLGTLPYTILVLGHVAETGDTLGTLHSALFGNYASAVANTGLRIRDLLLSLGFLVYNYPGLTIPLALGALLFRPREPRFLYVVLGCELAVYGLFVARYSIADRYTFFFPVYALLAVLAGLGLARVLGSRSSRVRRLTLIAATVTTLWTPLVYATAARVCASRGVFASLVGNKPFRDGYRTFFVPWGVGDDAASRLNRVVIEQIGSDGLVLIADNMIRFGIRYAQVVGQIPAAVAVTRIEGDESPEQVRALRAELQAALDADRPVILVPGDRDHPATPLANARWRRVEDVYRLVALDSPASLPAVAPE